MQDGLAAPRLEVLFIPLGAGDASHCVRVNGWVFEAVSAAVQRRSRRRLYHSVMHVHLDRRCHVIEMAPVWSGPRGDHGARATGPVGLPSLGRFAAFRYEVRCWEGGTIPDLDHAVGGARVVPTDAARLSRLLSLTAAFPAFTWGRDEQHAGEMWNSNSLISWLLAVSGHEADDVTLPRDGRAPGWDAGLVVARRRSRRVHPDDRLPSRAGRPAEVSSS
jgi:hypothetical protein